MIIKDKIKPMFKRPLNLFDYDTVEITVVDGTYNDNIKLRGILVFNYWSESIFNKEDSSTVFDNVELYVPNKENYSYRTKCKIVPCRMVLTEKIYIKWK